MTPANPHGGVIRRTELMPAPGGAAMRPVAALSYRDRAILRAVSGGGAELVAGAEPDLYLDGRSCSDQFAAHRLVHAGLITTLRPVAVGRRTGALLTEAGRACLDASTAPPAAA